MTDTKKPYTGNVEFKNSIYDSISRQFMVPHDVEIPFPAINKPETNYVTSGKRSFEAAKGYNGKKVAVPKLPHDEWYKVDVITCAAPDFRRVSYLPDNYEALITSRIKKILDVACKERVEVLILGAWGCGAFKNPSEIVAKVFHTLLPNYDFETVEFAFASRDDVSNSIFAMK